MTYPSGGVETVTVILLIQQSCRNSYSGVSCYHVLLSCTFLFVPFQAFLGLYRHTAKRTWGATGGAALCVGLLCSVLRELECFRDFVVLWDVAFLLSHRVGVCG